MKSLSLGHKILFLINNIFALSLLLSYLTTFISPLFLKYSALLNFSIPFLWGINAIFVIIWLLKLRKQAFLSLTIIILGWFHIQKIFVFNNVEHQYGEGLKVMSYNVMQFYSIENVQKRTYQDINKFVNQHNPDIVCMQEFRVFESSLFPDYKYSIEDKKSGELKTNIFSKYPIINFRKFDFGKDSNNSAVYADIVVKDDTLRVFSIHFESLNLNSIIKNRNQTPNEKILQKMNSTYSKQITQFEILKPHIKNSPFKVIIGTDMNNTALSYLYRKLINLDLKDTFLESGKNYGKTFDLGLLPVRIDMILIDNQLKSSKFKNFKVNHSDHFPIMTQVHL